MVAFGQPHPSVGSQACVLVVAGGQCIERQSSHQDILGEFLKHKFDACRGSRKIPEQDVIDLVLLVVSGETVDLRIGRVDTQTNTGQAREV